MKNNKISLSIFSTLVVLLLLFSCNQTKVSDNQTKIENTLKSVSMHQDSLDIDLSKLFADFEKVNAVIDSIGYPDAGYEIWEVASDASIITMFIIEGYWPDQKTYDIIHNHELYKKAVASCNLKSIWYYRFSKVK